jgi:hypothetical protein
MHSSPFTKSGSTGAAGIILLFFLLCLLLCFKGVLAGSPASAVPMVSGIDGSPALETVTCPGVPVCFDVFTADDADGDDLEMTWDNGIPGASFQVSEGPRPAGHFCWTPEWRDARPEAYRFTVSVKDEGCLDCLPELITYRILVTNPKAELTVLPVSCPGRKDGAIHASVSGGTPPYTYSWSPAGVDGPDVAQLPGGRYQLVVSDDRGCTAQAEAFVDESTPLNIETNVRPATCRRADGTILATVSGGTMPYTYTWQPGNISAELLERVPAGDYTVKVTDANGCTAAQSVTLPQEELSVATLRTQNARCASGEDGSATLQTTGGTGPYDYLWFPYGGNGPSASRLSPGTYTVQVADVNGCTAWHDLHIGTDQTTSSLELGPDILGCTGNPVFLDAGNSWRQVSWSDHVSAPHRAVTSEGVYSVRAIDDNGCLHQDEVHVAFSECSEFSRKVIKEDRIRISPNPVTTSLTLAWNTEDGNDELRFDLEDGMGRRIQTIRPEYASGQLTLDMRGYPAGLYYLTAQRPGQRQTFRLIREE